MEVVKPASRWLPLGCRPGHAEADTGAAKARFERGAGEQLALAQQVSLRGSSTLYSLRGVQGSCLTESLRRTHEVDGYF